MDNEDSSLTLLQGLHSTPARRYLSEDPIPDEIILNILDAAIRGPSGGNRQTWGWIIVKDQLIKNQIAEWYREGWKKLYAPRKGEILEANAPATKFSSKNFLSAEHLANHLQDAPVWIIAVLRNTSDSDTKIAGIREGASIYGAIQNLMLAARAYNIGSTLTTLYTVQEDKVKELLNIPEDASTMGLIPLGYPIRGRWSQPKRQELEEVTYWDSWGATKNK